MPLFTKNTNKQNQANNSAQNQNTSQQVQAPKEQNLLQTLSQCLPFLPLFFEQFTGQKIPQLQGTIAEMQNSLSQIQSQQAQLLTNQEEIARHIENLESNASSQLNSLSTQVQFLKDTAFKLTHEKKEIEYKPAKETQSLNN